MGLAYLATFGYIWLMCMFQLVRKYANPMDPMGYTLQPPVVPHALAVVPPNSLHWSQVASIDLEGSWSSNRDFGGVKTPVVGRLLGGKKQIVKSYI